MSWIKVSAKSVADALMEASIQLGTSSDNIEYHVLEQGSSGLFGFIGAKKAVIEAKKKKTDEDLMKEVFGDMKESLREDSFRKELQTEEPEKAAAEQEVSKENRKETKKDSRKESARKERPEKKESAPAKESARGNRKEAVKDETASKSSQGEPAARETSARQENQERPRQANKDRESAREGGKNSRNGRRNQKRPKDGEASFQKKRAAVPEEKISVLDAAENVPVKTEEKVPRAPKEPADPEVVKKRAETFLKEVFRTMDMEVQIEMTFEEDSLSVNITGEEMGLLIGKRGQTLDSLQSCRQQGKFRLCAG